METDGLVLIAASQRRALKAVARVEAVEDKSRRLIERSHEALILSGRRINDSRLRAKG